MFISAILTAAGAGIKCLIDFGLIYLYIGQFLAAVGQPFILNSVAKVASTWYREDKVIFLFYLESYCYFDLLWF